eukprot:CAMPEP_0195006996 /NCGR_PEP_ID=MMETSP0326_2-20130528/7223_1 /TAXON_ID=2866 ORGANISM="Crypthecodinium cohnii, Strain Seligo" /NCGR_SAMPLE_ID=MMETSP0326_2 /ASSEMBLY_ACC=CAM_ASM_000348 /LENGTH=166 /DNA_ID=CAMNT_0040014107 /DNA_START=554 /DNA_END=1051 /DNA_ORIENTATION=-
MKQCSQPTLTSRLASRRIAPTEKDWDVASHYSQEIRMDKKTVGKKAKTSKLSGITRTESHPTMRSMLCLRAIADFSSCARGTQAYETSNLDILLVSLLLCHFPHLRLPGLTLLKTAEDRGQALLLAEEAVGAAHHSPPIGEAEGGEDEQDQHDYAPGSAGLEEEAD